MILLSRFLMLMDCGNSYSCLEALPLSWQHFIPAYLSLRFGTQTPNILSNFKPFSNWPNNRKYKFVLYYIWKLLRTCYYRDGPKQVPDWPVVQDVGRVRVISSFLTSISAPEVPKGEFLLFGAPELEPKRLFGSRFINWFCWLIYPHNSATYLST